MYIHTIRIKTMEIDYIFIVKIIAYFILYSFIGWAIESIYKSILQKKWVNTGFLNGPICPIYGIGALIMFLFLNKLHNRICSIINMGIYSWSIFRKNF